MNNSYISPLAMFVWLFDASEAARNSLLYLPLTAKKKKFTSYEPIARKVLTQLRLICHFDQVSFRSSVVLIKRRFDQTLFPSSVVSIKCCFDQTSF